MSFREIQLPGSESPTPVFGLEATSALARPDGTEALEIQVPNWTHGLVMPTVRYVYNEWGNVDKAHLIQPHDILWVPSRYVAERVARRCPHNRIVIVPHGVSMQAFCNEGERYPGLDEGPFRFLYIGTTISRKGFDLIWDAFRAERSNLPEAELVLRVQPDWNGWVWDGIHAHEERVR
jgi:glycosyltransferase involved in cell wall biosynthesis